jgi:hypothetical protein
MHREICYGISCRAYKSKTEKAIALKERTINQAKSRKQTVCWLLSNSCSLKMEARRSFRKSVNLS